DFAGEIAPALQIGGGVATKLVRIREQEDTDRLYERFQIPRDDKSVPSIVAFAAKNGYRARAQAIRISAPPIRVGNCPAGVFHQLRTRNAQPLAGKAVHLAHFGCGESFHGKLAAKFTARSEHPATTDVDDLTGNVFGFFRSKKRNRRGDVFDCGRTANGKARVTDAARF